jgi:hypothetical protein
VVFSLNILANNGLLAAADWVNLCKHALMQVLLCEQALYKSHFIHFE